MFLFIPLLLLCAIVRANEPLSIPFEAINSNSSLVSTTLDFPIYKTSGSFLIDTSSFYITIFSKTIKPSSDIARKVIYINGTVTGYESITDIKIPSLGIQLHNISILVVNDTSSMAFPDNISGILGLGFNYEDFKLELLSYSFIEHLYQNKIITERAFRFNYTSIQENRGDILIGNMTLLSANDNTTEKGECRALRILSSEDIFPYWQSAIKFIKIEYFSVEGFVNTTESYLLNEPLAFDTSISHIIFPEDFFNKTIMKILANKFTDRDKTCTLYRNEKEIYFTCRKIDYTFLHKIDFAFNPYILRIKDLFVQEAFDSFRFVIQSEVNGTRFLMGQTMLRKYNIMFDKSNEKILFETKEELENLTVRMYYMFFFVCLVLIGMIMFVAIFWYLVMMCVEKGYRSMRMRRRMKRKKKREVLITNLDLDL